MNINVMMHLQTVLIFGLGLVVGSSALNSSRITPPTGAVIVDSSSSAAEDAYSSVQAGVNALSTSTSEPQSLFIYPGTYNEQVYVPLLASNLTIQGYTPDSSSYDSNTVTITYNLALIDVSSDDLTATLRVWNPNTKVYNLNIANTFGHIDSDGQNLAVSAYTENQGYYGVQLLGYQDTLLASTGKQLYAKSLIVGAIDFIFGKHAEAWLEQVDIRTIATGYVTASGRETDDDGWYVISNSTVAGINSSIPAGSTYLGRPWEDYARVVFQDTYLSDVVNAAGWTTWSSAASGNIDHVTFAEYDNTGPGSVLEEGPRANFSEQLTQRIDIEEVLGDDYLDEWWVDETFLV